MAMSLRVRVDRGTGGGVLGVGRDGVGITSRTEFPGRGQGRATFQLLPLVDAVAAPRGRRISVPVCLCSGARSAFDAGMHTHAGIPSLWRYAAPRTA